MKPFWRKSSSDHLRKYDTDPTNSYNDGYRAGRDYYKDRLPFIIVYSVLGGQLLEVVAYWLGWL